jgi:TATA-box binding protein (TBP) (component of TFIID and TFIIIB)
MSLSSNGCNRQNNWDNYQHQINSYLSSIESNPYLCELRNDFKKMNIEKITKWFKNDKYKYWLTELMNSPLFDVSLVNKVNSRFTNTDYMKQFCIYIEKNIELNNKDQFLKILYDDFLDNIDTTISSIVPEIIFNPSELKFVTTTGLAIIDTSVDFKYLYKHFVPPENVVKSISPIDSKPYYNKEVINKVVGCKTGNFPVKGYFKKDEVGDFYNCATLQIVLGDRKCANVKLFNNGKMQLTGIPHPDFGTLAVKIICDLIRSIPDNKDDGSKIVFDKKRVTIKEYNTVMINTCYDLGIHIDRDITSNILNNRYNFHTVWEGDGYPGVRILYYYNSSTVGTDNEGRCICSTNSNTSNCTGKGSGNGINDCRKISIALFQSGKVIIAGGCKHTDPIFSVYKLFNSIIGEIIHEIRKIDNSSDKKTLKKKKEIFINKSSILNIDIYDIVLALLE